MNSDLIARNALRLLGVLAIVLINGFFVAAEFAFVKLRDTQLETLVVAGNRRARLARHILQHLTSHLSATQLGNYSNGEPRFGGKCWRSPCSCHCFRRCWRELGLCRRKFRRPRRSQLAFSVATFLQIVLGELGPKWFAIQTPLPTALWVAVPLHWFYRISYPFNWILNQSAQWLLRRVGIEPSSSTRFVQTEEELRLMLCQRRVGGTTLGHAIVLNALDLSLDLVRNAMRLTASKWRSQYV